MSNEQPFDRLDRFIKEDRLVRKSWGDGHHRACLLAAMAPEVMGVGEPVGDPDYCPAELLPGWFAFIVPAMDDRGSDLRWSRFVRRFAKVIKKTASFLPADWHALDYEVRAIGFREAARYVKNAHLLKEVETLAAFFDSLEALDPDTARPEVGAWTWPDGLPQADRRVAFAIDAAFEDCATSETLIAAGRAARAYGKRTSPEAGEEAWDRMSGLILDAIERRS